GSDSPLRFWVWQAIEPRTQWRCYALAPFSVARAQAAMAFIPALLSIPFALLVATWASTVTKRLVTRPVNALSELARAIACAPEFLHQAKDARLPNAQQLPLEIAQLTE
ncbi:MAG: hypothetical protein CFK52_15135, partial [Chloracidobacterium sp. CP2_5A]